MTERKVTAKAMYEATTAERGGILNTGYTALEMYGGRGNLAFRLMEVERQTKTTKQAYLGEFTGDKFWEWKVKKLDGAVQRLRAIFERHGKEVGFLAELRDFKYGFRVRIKGYKYVVRYEKRLRGAAWKSGEHNLEVVMAYTEQILEEIWQKQHGSTGTVPARHTA